MLLLLLLLCCLSCRLLRLTVWVSGLARRWLMRLWWSWMRLTCEWCLVD